MKKVFIIAIAAISLLSCKDDSYEKSKEIEFVSVQATEDNIWHYYCAGARKIVGTGSEEDNLKWAASDNWDIALQKYRIKINGGTSTTKNKGGLAAYSGTMLFDDILQLPMGLDFKVDSKMMETINGDKTTVSKSEHQVVNFVDGTTDYTKAPIYILRGDTGEKYYKIDFVNYMVNGEAGNIQFKIAQISK